MATFVLVHGANMGGWCWRLVTPSLRFGGHEAYAPSLTGLGDRAHLLSPEIGLETHIEDVANLLYNEDLDNVILVGHSNGGAIVTAVADRLPQRIAHVVYLDAMVPRDGESLWDLIPPGPRAWMEQQLETMGETWKSPPAPAEAWVEMARAEGWSEAVARWAAGRGAWQPLRPVREPMRLKGGDLADRLPRTLIRCTRSGVSGLDPMIQRASEAGWAVVELDTGHTPMLSDPQAVAELLLAIAEPYGA